MALDVSELAKKMFEAFESSLTDNWPEVKDYADGKQFPLEAVELYVW